MIHLYFPFYTRLMGRRNLLFPLAPLAVSLPASTCSHRLCSAWPAPRYPIGGTAKPVIAARAAGSQFASQQMLSRSLRASDTPPEVHLPESPCSPVFIIPVMGYGAKPHDDPPPLTFALPEPHPVSCQTAKGQTWGQCPHTMSSGRQNPSALTCPIFHRQKFLGF